MDKKKKVLVAIVISLVLIVIATGVGVKATSKPSFCTTCHEIKPAYTSWETSNHKIYGATCLDCHADSGEINLIKRKISSLKEIYIHLSNTPDPMDIKGNVPNSRCLECHSGKQGKEHAGRDVTKFTDTKGKIHNDKNLKCASCHIQSIHGDKSNTNKVAIVASDKCVACHTSEEKVAQMSTPLPPASSAGQG